ncbi:MAG: hypothetical protein ACTSQF_08295 [Candidatus Heimdallarchaeaceae archaeon]
MRKPRPPKTKVKPDRQFDIVIFKMMSALAFSVALLFGGGTFLVYAIARNIDIAGYENTVGTVLGIHLAALMVFYALALFKYIVSD